VSLVTQRYVENHFCRPSGAWRICGTFLGLHRAFRASCPRLRPFALTELI